MQGLTSRSTLSRATCLRPLALTNEQTRMNASGRDECGENRKSFSWCCASSFHAQEVDLFCAEKKKHCVCLCYWKKLKIIFLEEKNPVFLRWALFTSSWNSNENEISGVVYIIRITLLTDFMLTFAPCDILWHCSVIFSLYEWLKIHSLKTYVL